MMITQVIRKCYAVTQDEQKVATPELQLPYYTPSQPSIFKKIPICILTRFLCHLMFTCLIFCNSVIIRGKKVDYYWRKTYKLITELTSQCHHLLHWKRHFLYDLPPIWHYLVPFISFDTQHFLNLSTMVLLQCHSKQSSSTAQVVPHAVFSGQFPQSSHSPYSWHSPPLNGLWTVTSRTCMWKVKLPV